MDETDHVDGHYEPMDMMMSHDSHEGSGHGPVIPSQVERDEDEFKQYRRVVIVQNGDQWFWQLRYHENGFDSCDEEGDCLFHDEFVISTSMPLYNAPWSVLRSAMKENYPLDVELPEGFVLPDDLVARGVEMEGPAPEGLSGPPVSQDTAEPNGADHMDMG